MSVEKCIETLPEEGIKWMQEGNNKDRKGYTEGFNACLSQAKSVLSSQRETVIMKIKLLRECWNPTEGNLSEEEKGFQKGIMAQMRIKNAEIDDLITEIEKLGKVK